MPDVSGYVLSGQGNGFPFFRFQHILSTLGLDATLYFLFALRAFFTAVHPSIALVRLTHLAGLGRAIGL